MIVKHKLGLDDRGTIEMIQENIYLQYFRGLPCFTTRPVFDASLFVDIRKRLGGDEFEAFNQRVIEVSEQVKPPQSRIKRKQQQQKKTKKQVRRGIRGQLQYISRDIKIVDSLLVKPGRAGLLEKRDRELMKTIRKVYSQQKLMYENKTHQCQDRIVNLFQPHVRPIVRGKDKAKTANT